ncbi:MAG: hypothetical protein LUO82_00755 [Methanomicrobiales archaeon]|nr:hypothetical protein [Methanomicrobiales archaeon]
MNGQAMKLLDFTGMIEYRVGEYYSLPSTTLIVRENWEEVRGNAKE